MDGLCCKEIHVDDWQSCLSVWWCLQTDSAASYFSYFLYYITNIILKGILHIIPDILLAFELLYTSLKPLSQMIFFQRRSSVTKDVLQDSSLIRPFKQCSRTLFWHQQTSQNHKTFTNFYLCSWEVIGKRNTLKSGLPHLFRRYF